MGSYGRAGPPDIRDTYSLLVLNITFRTSADDLFPFFDRCGKVVDIFIPRDRRTGESRGFAFVRYKHADEAQKAIERLDGKDIDGRNIVVQFAKYGRNDETIQRGKITSASPIWRSSRSDHHHDSHHRGDHHSHRARRERDRRRSRSRSRSRERYDRERNGPRERYERERDRPRDRDQHREHRRHSRSRSRSRGRGKSPRVVASPTRKSPPVEQRSPPRSPSPAPDSGRACAPRSPSPARDSGRRSASPARASLSPDGVKSSPLSDSEVRLFLD